MTAASVSILKSLSDLHTDPAHGRPLPKGQALYSTLRSFLDRQSVRVMDWVRSLREVPFRPPSLGMWTQPMADAVSPAVEEYRRRGARQVIAEVVREAARERGLLTDREAESQRARVKRANSTPTVDEILRDAWSVFNVEVADSARNAAWSFCSSTNATATQALAAALRDAREGLARGLEQGEALAVLTVRVQAHFGDPLRAARIAMTEASRAVHAGQQQLAMGTDGLITRKKWLASSDACEQCLKLDGMSVPIESHFVVDGDAGPYAVVEHPPRHPHCACAQVYEVDL